MRPSFLPALKTHLSEALKEMRLMGQGGDGDVEVAPAVFIGVPPPKNKNNQLDVPCVIIVPASGYQQEGAAFSDVGLVCCVYNPERGDNEACELDMFFLLSRVVESLVPIAQGQPLDARYELIADERGRLLSWERAPQHPRYFLETTILTRWQTRGWA